MPDEEPCAGERIDTEDVRGFLHVPKGDPVAALALTHGAGGDCSATVLSDVATEWAAHGVVVLRFDLAFRHAKPTGPPHPSRAAVDRVSVVSAANYVRGRSSGPLLLGGHSYGGRQASMVVAENEDAADGLVLLSYPLHPPGKPEKARTAHFPTITKPALFAFGTKDPFGTPTEIRGAISAVSAPTATLEVTGAGHELSAKKHQLAARSLEVACRLFSFEPTR